VTTIAFIGAEPDQVQQAMDAAATTRALVLEPDAGTAHAMRARRDWAAWTASGRLAVLAGPDYQGATAVARAFPDLHAARVVVDPRRATSDAADVERAREVLSRLAFATKANDTARRALGGRYLLHTLANTARLARESDVRALAGLGRGQAAIIVAAGPSLDTNIHALVPWMERAIVIACDTAARPLTLTGVEPDFIVASDPSPVNASHLTGLSLQRTWLVGEGSLHASAFGSFDRRTFVFRVSTHQPWPWLESFGLDRGLLTTWGSVATSAFSLALSMGCDPIVFVGSDLAFTGNRPYCRGTTFEAQWSTWVAGGSTLDAIWTTLIDKWPHTLALDIHGRQVRTAPHLVAFRDWLVEQSGVNADRRIVNATHAGLLHGGRIAQASLADAVAARLSIDREALHRSIRAAHIAKRGDPVRAFLAIDEVVGAPAHPQRRAWHEFTSGTVPDAAVDLALKTPEYLAWSLARTAAALSKEQA
jgi:hypothetical protein